MQVYKQIRNVQSNWYKNPWLSNEKRLMLAFNNFLNNSDLTIQRHVFPITKECYWYENQFHTLPLKTNLTINGKLGDLSVVISKASFYPIHDWAKCRPLGRVLIPALLHKIIPTKNKNTTLHQIRRVEVKILIIKYNEERHSFLLHLFQDDWCPKKMLQ